MKLALISKISLNFIFGGLNSSSIIIMVHISCTDIYDCAPNRMESLKVNTNNSWGYNHCSISFISPSMIDAYGD